MTQLFLVTESHDGPTMTIHQALNEAEGMLHASTSPKLDARLLLQHILNQDHTYLITQSDRTLSAEEGRRYMTLVHRAVDGEPIPYLLGYAPFHGREFAVSPDVLIPRPETEILVETALDWVEKSGKSPGSLFIVDVGTGSGCIAVTMACLLPGARIIGIDRSKAALDVARQNAERHGADQLQLHQGELLEPIVGYPDLILANLPYVADHEWTALDDGVKLYEPDIALRGGLDGLDLIRQLIDQAQRQLALGGAMFLEIGWKQGPAVRLLAQSRFPSAEISVLPDYAGRDRVLGIVNAE